MNRNISTHFHHISGPSYLIDIIERETTQMQRRHPRIRGFKISVELSHMKHRHGKEVRAKVSVILRNTTMVASKEVDGMSEQENAATALHRAFAAVDHEIEHHSHHSHGTSRFRAPSPFQSTPYPASQPEGGYLTTFGTES